MSSSAGSARQGVLRDKERVGGVRIGPVFFGWMAATDAAILLTALAAAGAVAGLATNSGPGEVTNGGGGTSRTVGPAGIIVLLAIVFTAQYSGGYLAGRMARVNGMRQGLCVWLWAIVTVTIAAGLSALAGGKFNILAQIDSLPMIPSTEGTLTAAGVIAALLAAAAAALAGALLGGLAGMRFHRKAGRTGVDP
ncbi:MAG: hypothetical protein ACHP7K_12100 [Actinomycetales bacterium]